MEGPSTGSDRESVNGECYFSLVQFTPSSGGPQTDSQGVTCQGTGLGLKFKSGSEPGALCLNLNAPACNKSLARKTNLKRGGAGQEQSHAQDNSALFWLLRELKRATWQFTSTSASLDHYHPHFFFFLNGHSCVPMSFIYILLESHPGL